MKEGEIIFDVKNVSVDWNAGGDSCGNSTGGKSNDLRLRLGANHLVGAVPAESVRRNGNQRHRRKERVGTNFRSNTLFFIAE